MAWGSPLCGAERVSCLQGEALMPHICSLNGLLFSISDIMQDAKMSGAGPLTPITPCSTRSQSSEWLSMGHPDP